MLRLTPEEEEIYLFVAKAAGKYGFVEHGISDIKRVRKLLEEGIIQKDPIIMLFNKLSKHKFVLSERFDNVDISLLPSRHPQRYWITIVTGNDSPNIIVNRVDTALLRISPC